MGIARLNVNLLPMYQVYNAKRKNSRIHICVLLPTTLLKDRSFLQIKCCTRQDKIMSFQIKIFELVKSRKLLIYPFLFWSGFSKTIMLETKFDITFPPSLAIVGIVLQSLLKRVKVFEFFKDLNYYLKPT